jgi:type I restriction enzyme, S subunit
MSTEQEWVTKPLGEVIRDMADGGTPDTNRREYFGGPIPWVVIQDIRKEILASRTTLTHLGLHSCSAKLWPVGSVILSTGATIGEVGMAMVPLATKQGIHGIVCADELASIFLYYKLQTLRNFLNANAQGSTIREVRAPFLRTISISFPRSLNEQIKIAEILSSVDRAVEQTETLIAKQQRIKTGLTQDLLTRGIDEHGNLRSEETHAFKGSPLGKIPVEWDAMELRSCLSYLSYGFTNPMPEAIDGPYMITAANISNGLIQYDSCRRTTAEAFKTLLTNKSRPQIGDILITKDGTLGRLAIVDRAPLCINQSVAVMRAREGADHSYLKMLLESAAYQRRIMKEAGGSTIKHIYISKIDKLMIALPRERAEQEAIKERLSSQVSLLHQLEAVLHNLVRIKTGLMQDLLTGKRRVIPLLASESNPEKIYAQY